MRKLSRPIIDDSREWRVEVLRRYVCPNVVGETLANASRMVVGSSRIGLFVRLGGIQTVCPRMWEIRRVASLRWTRNEGRGCRHRC